MSEFFASDLVGELVALLRALPFEVAELPKDPSPKGFTHKHAALWVGYVGSNYGRPEATDCGAQARTLLFDVQLLVRDLSGPGLTAKLVDQARRLVHGRKLSVGAPVRMVRDGFVGHKDGIWQHEVVFSVEMTCIPVEGEAQSGPTLVDFKLEDKDGNLLLQLQSEEAA